LKKTSGIILTAATADDTICNVFGYLPTGLIPVNGKPIIFYILKQFIENDIKDIYIGVDYKKEDVKDVLDTFFKDTIRVKFIITDRHKGVGNSLLTIFNHIKTDKVVINLADTYIKNFNYQDLSNQIVVSKDFTDGRRWASIKKNNSNKILSFFNKKKVSKEHFVIAGVYVLDNVSIFKNFKLLDDNIEITHLLEFYASNYDDLYAHETIEWMDFGHIDQYYSSKKKLIQSREFNDLEYDDFFGTITKKSLNEEKFKNEILWYNKIPNELKIISPRVLEYSIDSPMFLKSEFYSYPALSEIWLFSNLNDNILKSIINKLLKIINLFKNIKKKVDYSNYKKIYIDKTLERVNNIKSQKILSLLSQDSIMINNQKYDNWHVIKSVILKKVELLYNEDDNCFIHGDLCLSNILYDLNSGVFKLIDPRGSWGSSENGDVKYDVAKLRHSISGEYDYIIGDLFNINYVNNNEINYSIFSKGRKNIKQYFDKQIDKEFSIDSIILIQGLLFLSMIPLHKDSEERQLLMFCKAIESLNQSIKN
tara:strand:+ start:725 stop:2332 length:1608 start_codon:yes stop_codon:yes gene_type:complete